MWDEYGYVYEFLKNLTRRFQMPKLGFPKKITVPYNNQVNDRKPIRNDRLMRCNNFRQS